MGIGFKNNVAWEHYDDKGNLVGCGESHNVTCTYCLNEIIDALSTGTFDNSVGYMAIGTGSGAGAGSSALISKVSDETLSSETDNGTSLECVATFTCTDVGGWSIGEAGLFGVVTCDSNMLFVDDAISESLSQNDTLTITWTITVADA